MKRHYLSLISMVIAGITLVSTSTASRADSLLFLSTQLTPAGEAAKLRREILDEYFGDVEFQPNDSRLAYHQVANALLATKPHPNRPTPAPATPGSAATVSPSPR